MSIKVDVPVMVEFTYDPVKKVCQPVLIKWEGREYEIVKIGLHHVYRQGKTLFHVFSVASRTAFFRLKLNTDNLFWRLEEVGNQYE